MVTYQQKHLVFGALLVFVSLSLAAMLIAVATKTRVADAQSLNTTNIHSTSLAPIQQSVYLPLVVKSRVPGVWASNGPNGGQINALAIDPQTPSTVYAGTNGGGVFK